MKKTTKTVIYGTASALALSMACSSAVFAADTNAKCGGKNVAVANVSDSLLIRESADDSGKVIGYIPSAGGAIVKSIGSDWTKVQVGNTVGYVKTGYLAFDEKAEELKSVYGVLGAVAAWDDVKIFSDYEDTSSIIGTLDEGEGFEILGSTDNWVEIQLASGDTAYVAAEDIQTTLVLESSVPLEEGAKVVSTKDAEETPEVQDTAVYEQNTADDTYDMDSIQDSGTDISYETEAAMDPVYETENWTDSTYETESWTDSTYETESWTDSTYETEDWTDTTYETEDWTDTSYETESTETDSWVDDSQIDSDDDGITGDEYIDPSTEESGDTAVNSDDLDLLAALIYCEAGNQSEEGKVAVGQVVMNRVASDSFANSINDVIYESGQFTPASSGWLESVLGNVPQDCYDAAAAAMSGEGTVGDALYFNTGSGKGVKIGAHQFY